MNKGEMEKRRKQGGRKEGKKKKKYRDLKSSKIKNHVVWAATKYC